MTQDNIYTRIHIGLQTLQIFARTVAIVCQLTEAADTVGWCNRNSAVSECFITLSYHFLS